jgi:K+-sensing histidine kinase KdpD
MHDVGSFGSLEEDPRRAAAPPLPLIVQYGLAFVFVALATGLAFLVQPLISAPNVTLIYVLPVIVSATLFGWGPSLLAVAVGVVAFDFFFSPNPIIRLR